MTPRALRQARRRSGLTQGQLADALGTSQGYVSLLERGLRTPSKALARRMARVLELSPTALPFTLPDSGRGRRGPAWLAARLARLGYPGFAYLRRRGAPVNPAEVLLHALGADPLEPRLLEALPWLLLRFEDLDAALLVEPARHLNVQNRLGFVVSLARALAESEPRLRGRAAALRTLESALEPYRLAREDDLGQSFRSDRMKSWVREQRTEAARHWNLLTDLAPASLDLEAWLDEMFGG